MILKFDKQKDVTVSKRNPTPMFVTSQYVEFRFDYVVRASLGQSEGRNNTEVSMVPVR